MQQRPWLKNTVALLLVFYRPLSNAGIIGSAHDFRSLGWNPSAEICVACHTPHSSQTTSGAPLWNHTESTTSYTLYASPTLIGTIEQPRPASKLCLSCHDGTIALDSFGGAVGATFIQGSAKLGIDLSSSHPISITWEHRDAKECFNCHLIKIVDGVAQTLFISALPFYNGRVKCPTCHEPHNHTPGNPSPQFMLRKTLTQSALCMHCHNK